MGYVSERMRGSHVNAWVVFFFSGPPARLQTTYEMNDLVKINKFGRCGEPRQANACMFETCNSETSLVWFGNLYVFRI